MAPIKTIKIHKRTFRTIALGLTILLAAIFIVSWIAVMGGFSKLEKLSVQRNIFRSQEVVADTLNNLAVKIGDWTIWDDTYAFIEDKNEAYITSNLTPLTLETLQIDMMLFFNARGELVFNHHRESDEAAGQLLRAEFKDALGTLLAHQNENSSVAGIVMLSDGPLMLVSRPIVKSNGMGPIRGTVIFGARLDADEMRRFSQIVRVELSAEKIAGISTPPDFTVARTAFLKGSRTFLSDLDGKTVAGYSLLKNITGKDVLMLKVSMPREITQFGIRTLIYFFIALVIVGVIFGVAVYIPLEKEIAGRDEAEKAFRKADERYRELVEGTEDLITIVDRRGRLTYVNHSAEKIFGIKPEDCIGRSAFDFIHVDDQERTKAIFEGWVRGKEKQATFQNRQVSKEGRVFEMLWNVNLYFADSGELLKICSFARDISGLKRMEAESLKARHLSELLIESLPGIFYLFDNKGKFLRVNDNLVKVSGYSQEELMGMHPLNLFSDHEKNRVKEGLEKVFAKGEAVLEAELVSKNGKKTFFYFTGHRVILDNVPLLVGVGIDISDRKRAEERLRDSEEKLKVLFAYAPDGLYLCDLNGVFVDGNRVTEELSGYKIEELIGKDFLRSGILSSSDVPPMAAAIAQNALGHSTGPTEYELDRKDGSSVAVEIRTYPVKINGEMMLLGSMRDISERKRTEEALQESEKRFMDVLHTSQDAILLIDGDKFVDCNEATVQMLGYATREEFLKRHPSELSPPEQPDVRDSFEKANEMMKIALDQGYHRFEWVYKKADGELFAVEVSLTSLVIHGRNILHCLWRDITENKRLAEALKRSHDNLEQQVKERTEELVRSFQKLQSTDEELKRASRAKNEFLANVSHEFRTPLNSIIGFSEVLFDERFGPLNERQKKYAQNVLLSGQHLLSLINDVLDLSKVESGKMVMEASSFSLKSTIEEVFRMMENQARAKRIKPVMEVSGDLGEIYADQRKIKQVIYNLLSNAIKFTPDGGKVGIRIQKVGAGVEGVVWDSGVGISPENFERVFIAFQRLGDLCTQETEGTGLGLTISRKIIELHGGKIWIESEGVGKGTSVKFTIPTGGILK
ncbi:MAG: PAS domain S-box protein [Candidatus Omnitrophota bacterium]